MGGVGNDIWSVFIMYVVIKLVYIYYWIVNG